MYSGSVSRTGSGGKGRGRNEAFCCTSGAFLLEVLPSTPCVLRLGDKGRSDWLRRTGLRHPSRTFSVDGLLLPKEPGGLATMPDSSNSKSAKTWESRFVVLTKIGLEISVPRKDSRLRSFSPAPPALSLV